MPVCHGQGKTADGTDIQRIHQITVVGTEKCVRRLAGVFGKTLHGRQGTVLGMHQGMASFVAVFNPADVGGKVAVGLSLAAAEQDVTRGVPWEENFGFYQRNMIGMDVIYRVALVIFDGVCDMNDENARDPFFLPVRMGDGFLCPGILEPLIVGMGDAVGVMGENPVFQDDFAGVGSRNDGFGGYAAHGEEQGGGFSGFPRDPGFPAGM